MSPSPTDAAQGFGDTRLVPSYTFEEFVVGPHNRFPHAAALAVSENLGKAYNPLFIYGPVGIGKTHLMQGVGHRVLQRDPKTRVLYVTAQQFMTEVIELLQAGRLQHLRESYRSLDLLLVDDIQFLATSEATQEEFFHMFNDLHAGGKQIIMTSDRPPKMLTTLEDRLRSRFEWGLIADIKLTNLETRVAILRKKEVHLKGLHLADDIRLYIASRLKSNIRELEGFLRRIQAYTQLNNQEVSLPLVKEILKELLPPEEWTDDDTAVAAPIEAPPPVSEEAIPDISSLVEPPLESPVEAAPVEPDPVNTPELSSPAPEEEKAPPIDLAGIFTDTSSPADSTNAAEGMAIPMTELSQTDASPAPNPVIQRPGTPLPLPPAPKPPVASPATTRPLPGTPVPMPGTPIAGMLQGLPNEVPVVFFYPQRHDKELVQLKKKFDDIIKKHKLKFVLHPALEVDYSPESANALDFFVEKCRQADVRIAVVLGPAPDSGLHEGVFFSQLQEALEPAQISLQLIPWDELNKDYRFLNLALDITLVRIKQKKNPS